MNIAFKVVRKDCGILRSATRTGMSSVDYTQKGWIRPNPGMNQFLFVFKTREDAEVFVDGRVANGLPRNEFKVLPVEIENPQPQATTRSGFLIQATNYPKGTIFCSALRVLNKRTAYKVVSDGSLGFYFSSSGQYARRVAYKVGKITKPKTRQNQFLFVFKTLEEAKMFKRCYLPYGTILKVQAYGTSREALKKNGLIAKAIDFPRGTMFCKALSVTERVSP